MEPYILLDISGVKSLGSWWSDRNISQGTVLVILGYLTVSQPMSYSLCEWVICLISLLILSKTTRGSHVASGNRLIRPKPFICGWNIPMFRFSDLDVWHALHYSSGPMSLRWQIDDSKIVTVTGAVVAAGITRASTATTHAATMSATNAWVQLKLVLKVIPIWILFSVP